MELPPSPGSAADPAARRLSAARPQAPGAGTPRLGLRAPALWAVLDQCLFGASNLLLNVLLARWLAPEQYGAFASALSILFLAGILHAALFVEPMLVLGSKRRSQQDAYLRLLVSGHALFGIGALGLCVAVAALLLAFERLATAQLAAALGLAMPCVLGSWLARRIFYLRSSPRAAAIASAGYLAAILVGLGFARHFGVLNAAVALGTMAAAGAIVAAALLRALRIPIFERPEPGLARRMLGEHWSLSRWLVLMAPFEWIPGNFYYLALPALSGLGAPALLKAAMNLVQPLLQVFGALRIVLTPALVDAAHSRRHDRPALRAGAAMVGGALLWCALLQLFGDALAQRLYAGAYPDLGPMLRVLAWVPLFFALGAVASGMLRARERTRHELWVGVAASLLSVSLGLPPAAP